MSLARLILQIGSKVEDNGKRSSDLLRHVFIPNDKHFFPDYVKAAVYKFQYYRQNQIEPSNSLE